MEQEKILAMAVAAVAEENHTDFNRVKVLSFKEVKDNCLKLYIEKNKIIYHKYQLEDSGA